MANNTILQIILISSRNDIQSFCRTAFSGKIDFQTMQVLSYESFCGSNLLLLDASLLLNASTQILEKIKTNQNSIMIVIPSDADSSLREYCEAFCSNLVSFPIEQSLFALRVTNMIENASDCFISGYTDDTKVSDSLLGFFGGNSPSIREVRAKIAKAASIDSPVLLLGETGTGKSTAASVIHKLSKRKENPFRSMNVSTISDSLACSTLFGTESGAYTDAVKADGLYKITDGGTLFLDELGMASAALQAMLLTVLETGMIQKVGGSKSEKVDVRTIFATNASIGAMLQEGTFRKDLYFRISDVLIQIPPLRERKEDLRIMASDFAMKNGRSLSEDAIQKIEGYNWPGNIRELHQCLARAIRNCNSDVISAKYLDFGIFNVF